MTAAAKAQSFTAVGGPCDGQHLIVTPRGGRRGGGAPTFPAEVWVCRPVPMDADPIPGPYHRYIRDGEGYRYSPEI